MRIATQIFLVIFTCSAGAVAVVGAMNYRYAQIDQLQARYRAGELAARDITYAKTMFAQWLVTVDLFFGEQQSYLASGAYKQSNQLISNLDTLVSLADPGQIETLKSEISKGRKIIEGAATGDPNSKAWNQALSSFDELSVRLIEGLDSLQRDVNQSNTENKESLAAARSTFHVIVACLLTGYAVLAGIVWRWASLDIVNPLVHIADAAARAADEAEGLELETEQKGPREVRQLAEQLGTFSERIHSAKQKATFAKDRVTNIIASAPDAIITTDPEGVIGEFNQAATRLFSLDRAVHIGATISALIPDLEEITIENGWVSSIQGLRNREFNGMSADEKIIPIEVSASVTSTKDQQVLTFIVRDISVRKENENELSELNQQLMDASRMAGIGEIATSLLHNIGNVLNSVQTSNSVVREKLAKTRLSGLAKAVSLLKDEIDAADFSNASEKLPQLATYLEKLADELARERTEIAQEFERSSKNVVHIEEIVKSQQKFAGNTGFNEFVHIPDVVNAALNMNRGGLENSNVVVSTDFDDLEPIWADKHKIMQIVVNLIRNAKEAIIEQQPPNPSLEISAYLVDKDLAEIHVKDNGVGIAPDVREKLFSHGFTTKKEGHGFGLHSCSLAAKNLGGSIEMESDGPGLGASFILRIPYKVEAASNE